MTVIIRADTSAEIGLGHVMRCIALTQALKRRRTRSVFVLRDAEGVLLERVQREGAAVVFQGTTGCESDVAFTASVARDNNADWIVVDGYDFDPNYLAALGARGQRVLYVDDMGLASLECDVVLNQNLHALDASYSRAAHTRLLLGPDYAMLREEFTADLRVDPNRASTDNPRILVTLGGGDPENCTLRVIDTLASLSMEGTEIRVIMGAAFAHGDSVRSRVRELKVPTEVFMGVDDVVKHMLWADRCITAGGSTCWEYCRLGVPMAVGIIAQNQVDVATSIERHGLGINLGWLTRESSASLRERLASWLFDVPSLRRAAGAASALVDGRGAGRVADVLLEQTPRPLRGGHTA